MKNKKGYAILYANDDETNIARVETQEEINKFLKLAGHLEIISVCEIVEMPEYTAEKINELQRS
jgi:hypothetical protein